MMFSTKQIRHLFVLKNKVSTAASLADVGDFYLSKVFTADGPAMHVTYMGHGSVTHSDLIPIGNIRRITYAPAGTLRTALPAVTITANAAGVVGTEYLLTLRFPEYISLTPEEDFVKTISFVFNATDGNIAVQLKAAIDAAFARDHNNLITTTTVGTTGVTITSNEQPWRLGLMENRPIRCIVSGLKAFASGVESTWGTVTDATDVSTAFMKNGYITADLEYFCMGARGDQYRQVGFPHTIDTEYVLTKADARTKEYDYITIHYFYQGEGFSNDYSEKVIQFVAEVPSDFSYGEGAPIYDLEQWLLTNVAADITAGTTHFSPMATPTALAVPAGTLAATQAVISWTAGAEETAWELDYKAASADEWTTVVVKTTASKTVTELTAATAYKTRVRAMGANGIYSPYTAVVDFTTAQA